jgi:hypothetical protein
MPLESSAPPSLPKVSGHACCDMGDGQRLLLFGGLQSDRTATNDIWIFDRRKPSVPWTKVVAESVGEKEDNGPGPRMYAVAARLEDCIFVVGGWDPEAKGSGGSFKDEVLSIDTKTMKWTQHAPLPCGPVSRHTACTLGSTIVIHTYKEGDDGVIVLFQDGTSHKQATTGEAPTGVSMCAAAPLGDSKMLVYGGSTQSQALSEFAYLLDTDTWKWTRLESRGEQLPTSRASSSMAAMDDSTCLVFGGAGISKEGYQGGSGLIGLDETWKIQVVGDKYADWTRLYTDSGDMVPRARCAASLNLLGPGERAQTFLLTGGWDPATAETFHEPWTIEL